MNRNANAVEGDRSILQFASPASTSLDELVQLRGSAVALQRRLRKRPVATHVGNAASRKLGRGLDFAEVREYQPGDDVRMIDWNVTARTGTTHTKLFVEERERPVFLVVDFRSGMRFGTRGMYKSVLAARLASLAGWSAVAANDRVGGFVFTDDWHADVRPAAGRRGLMGVFRAIVQSQQMIPGHQHGQLAACLKKLRNSVHSGSSVILLSDFHGFDTDAQSALGGILHSVDMVAIHIVDQLDHSLPSAGQYALSAGNSATSEQRLSVKFGSRRQHRAHQQRFAERQQQLRDFFAQGGHPLVIADTNKSLLDTAAAVLGR